MTHSHSTCHIISQYIFLLTVGDVDIFVNCNWVDTRWQQYSTHLPTNNTIHYKQNITPMSPVRHFLQHPISSRNAH